MGTECPELYNYVCQFIKRKLVFDIGSNIGVVSKKLTDNGAIVLAVEPQIELTLHENYRDVSHIIAGYCVSDKRGESEFFIAEPKYKAISTCLKEWKDIHPKVKYSKTIISTETLRDLIDKYGIPTYIKIDVEGFEYNVLSTLDKKIDFISFEFTKGFDDTFIKCLEKINEIGFKSITTFVKKKIKTYPNNTSQPYSLINKFSSINDTIKYFKSLSYLEQGDILIES